MRNRQCMLDKQVPFFKCPSREYFLKRKQTSEKIKILTSISSSLTKNDISSLFPDITIHMIERAINLVQEKGVYSVPEAYTGHPIDKRTKKKLLWNVI